MDAYKKGVADDPQNGDIVLQLLRVAPPQERDVVVSHYKALKDIDSWFPYFADILLEDSDIQALRVLLSIHQLLYPNDKNLDVVNYSRSNFDVVDFGAWTLVSCWVGTRIQAGCCRSSYVCFGAFAVSLKAPKVAKGA